MKNLLFSIMALVACLVTAKITNALDLDFSANNIKLVNNNGIYELTIQNISLEDVGISATWQLDLSTASWTITSASTDLSPDLQFTPDPGIRMEEASNPGAVVDYTTGTVYLYYEHKTGSSPGTKMVASSSDGLNFSQGEEAGHLHARLSPYCTLLPDGTWKKYIYSEPQKALVSLSSQDGYNFSQDEGYRYTLQPSDNGTFGVYDTYVDHTGGVVLLYVGSMGVQDNVRRAYSTDGGNTFELETDNLLGDRDLDLKWKFVDPKTLLLPDGRRRLITMRRGPNGTAPLPGERAITEIHTFISKDGKEYHHEPGIRLKPEDFTEFSVWSLNDPVLVRLPDGRYRIYVSALITDTPDASNESARRVIVSATSKYPEDI